MCARGGDHGPYHGNSAPNPAPNPALNPAPNRASLACATPAHSAPHRSNGTAHHSPNPGSKSASSTSNSKSTDGLNRGGPCSRVREGLCANRGLDLEENHGSPKRGYPVPDVGGRGRNCGTHRPKGGRLNPDRNLDRNPALPRGLFPNRKGDRGHLANAAGWRCRVTVSRGSRRMGTGRRGHRALLLSSNRSFSFRAVGSCLPCLPCLRLLPSSSLHPTHRNP